MKKIIIKHIENLKFKDEQQCIEVLVNDGLVVTNNQALKFTENYNAYRDSPGNNLFKMLMKGRVSFDHEKNAIKWILSINGLLIKIILIFIVVTLVWLLLSKGNWIDSIIIAGIYTIVVLGINWLRLNKRLDRLTNNMTKQNG